jgi:hypothetical protein
MIHSAFADLLVHCRTVSSTGGAPGHKSRLVTRCDRELHRNGLWPVRPPVCRAGRRKAKGRSAWRTTNPSELRVLETPPTTSPRLTVFAVATDRRSPRCAIGQVSSPDARPPSRPTTTSRNAARDPLGPTLPISTLRSTTDRRNPDAPQNTCTERVSSYPND